MKCFAITIMFALVAMSVSAEIYKWTDENGNIHFSDKPIQAEAEKVDVFISDGGNAPAAPAKPAYRTREKTPVKSTRRDPAEKSKSLITAADYNISVNVRERSGVLYFSGRIEGGPECPRLLVDMYAHTSGGGIANASVVVNNAGGFGSKLIDAKTKARQGKGDDWDISSIFASCN